jgi:AcrR family transcriptional regulator
MPKGFSEQEKVRIRQSLLERGRELFEQYGLKKTSVEELARAAGISKGAFYLFFNSKEELFLEILESFEREFRAAIFESAYHQGDKSSREKFKRMLTQAFVTWDSYRLLKRLDTAEYEILLRRLPPDRVRAHVQNDDAFVTDVLAQLKQSGVPISRDPHAVSGLMKALFFVSLHKDDFGSDAYPDIMRVLIDIIAAYVVDD